MTARGSHSRRWLRRVLWLGLALLAIDQIVLRVVVSDDRIFGVPLLPYFPPEFGSEEAEAQPRLVEDAELGWRLASKDEGGSIELDWTGGRLGSRSLQQNKWPLVRRIVILGGSITLGSELAGHETFAAQLETRPIPCNVVNLSTPLYGVDQLLMRLRADGLRLEPDEIWLAFEPSTALVATTRYLPLVRRESGEALLKPRFQIGEGDELSFLPKLTKQDAHEVFGSAVRYRDEFAPTEMWASRSGTFAIPGLGEHFFLTKFVASLAHTKDLERDAQLIRRDSEAFRTLVALVREFEKEVTLAGARFRVLVLPEHPYSPGDEPGHRLFTDELRSYGIEVLELMAGENGWSASHHSLMADALQRVLEREN